MKKKRTLGEKIRADRLQAGKSNKGRKSKIYVDDGSDLDEQLIAQMVKLIGGGNYIETAAAAAGIAKQTFYNWLKEGARNPQGPYGQVAERFRRAMAMSEVTDLENIRRHSLRDWRASAWRLERRFPTHWQNKEQVEFLEEADPRQDELEESVKDYATAFGLSEDES
jgi:hypothetical protein